MHSPLLCANFLHANWDEIANTLLLPTASCDYRQKKCAQHQDKEGSHSKNQRQNPKIEIVSESRHRLCRESKREGTSSQNEDSSYKRAGEHTFSPPI